MKIDEFLGTFDDDNAEAIQEILDGMVHSMKADEASQINNDSPGAQLAYLSGGNDE